MATSAPVSRETIVRVLLKLLAAKGEVWEAEVQRRATSGQALEVKGISVGADVLQEALAQHRRGGTAPSNGTIKPEDKVLETLQRRQEERMASSATPPTAAASTGVAAATTGSLRWTPTTTSAGAMANKALLECEDAEEFTGKVNVLPGSKVAVLPKPDVLSSPTGEYLMPGEVAEVVARCFNRKDGRVYLRLRKYAGWVSTRSRMDFSKFVVVQAQGQPLVEPLIANGATKTRAAKMLQKVSEDWKPQVAPKGTQADAILEAGNGTEPIRFRAASSVAILTRPDIAGRTESTGSRINAKEEFLADGVYFRHSDGRAYLHLKDGRGWVSERNKTDFMRFAVEPVGPTDFADDDFQEAAPAKRAAGVKKVLIVERTDEVPAEARSSVGTVEPGGLQDVKPSKFIFRSDDEIWPEALRPPQPLDSVMRLKLRRISGNFGVKTRECEEDLAEVVERASSFGRACPAQKELLHYADTLRKEVQRLQKEWAEAVKAAIKDSVPTPSSSSTVAPEVTQGTSSSGVMPVQVRGCRWYCAMLGAADSSSGPSEESGSSTFLRHLGPLRLSQKDADSDLVKMKAQAVEKKNSPKPEAASVEVKESTNSSKRKGASTVEEAATPANGKRLKKISEVEET